MQLKQVEIHDFKSIKYEKIEIQRNQLCLVGKNECGKSSIIQAISYLNLEKQFTNKLINKSSSRYPKGFPVVVGLFELTEKDNDSLIQIINAVSYENNEEVNITVIQPNTAPLNFAVVNGTHYLEIKRWGNGIENISIKLSDKQSYAIEPLKNSLNKAQFLSEFIEQVYPTIELFEDEELLIEAATIDDLLSEEKRFETFRKLLYLGGCKDLNLLINDDDNFMATFHEKIETCFNEILQKHYKQDNILIKIRQTNGDKLNIIIKDSTKESFSIDERSPGFQFYFSFLINKLYANEKSGDKDVILLLDEPGNNLHPQGCKDLLVSFRDIAEKSQLFYTTHNPFLTIRNDIDSLFLVEKNPFEGTKIMKKTYLKKHNILRKELGILLNDSFLIGDFNLVVEGNTEQLAFHRLFQLEKYRELEWMNIYNADGVANIPQAVNYLGQNCLKLKGIVVLDSDNEANDIKIKKGYKENLATDDWEAVEINDAFTDKKDRTFEDLFPQDLYVTAYNEYCHLHISIFKDTFEPFKLESEIALPIVNTIKEHFKLHLIEGSKATITKQDVIRNLLDNIEKLEEYEQQKALDKVFKLVDKIVLALKKIENATK